jgi:hypothetical protein
VAIVFACALRGFVKVVDHPGGGFIHYGWYCGHFLLRQGSRA